MHETNRAPLILTIDDEEIIRETLKGYLEDSGYRVIQAVNGREGLEVFRHREPDLILVDLRMPEVDGLDVLKAVNAESPQTPIIVVSGTGVLQDAIDALRLGAWDYLTKPIQDMAVLEYAVDRALERRQLLRERDRHQERLEEEVRRRTRELMDTNEVLKEEVAEREKAQEGLRQSLAEKEVMLKEIHHRVKNNLQIISSLLYLQSQQITDPESRALFVESRDRVRSMALVHEKLYQSDDLARIDYQDYLRTIARSLVQSYRGGQTRVELDLDLDELFISVDIAIPCSLVANELLTNSMKYAFAGRDQGRISVTLRRDGPAAVMTVADDGVGFPPGLDYRKTETLGMQLVINLVEQLKGEISAEVEDGARFVIRFPLQ